MLVLVIIKLYVFYIFFSHNSSYFPWLEEKSVKITLLLGAYKAKKRVFSGKYAED